MSKPLRCSLMRRLRETHEWKRARAYYRAPVRLCRGLAIAFVRFADELADRAVCVDCFNRELLERPAERQLLEFSVIHRRASGRRRRPGSRGSYANALRGPPGRRSPLLRPDPVRRPSRGLATSPRLAVAA